MTPKFLTPDQVAHFLDRGYVVLPQAFSPTVASEWVDRGFTRLGYDRHDPSTWKVPRIHMPQTKAVEVAEFAPNVWEAVCDLLGGADRVAGPYRWGDAFIFNFSNGRDRPWEPPSTKTAGWHKDGDWFRHFLDSPEQGLLSIVCWTDMVHQGGGTLVAPDSIGLMSKFLAAHPEGIHPVKAPWREVIDQCQDFVELTASAGDVVLLHPFMVHAIGQNVLGVERAITNPAVYLKEPMNFNRPDPADFSLVELAVLKGLGVERYDFQPTAPRERIVPERERVQAKLLEEERARLAGAHPTV
jgi:hypothetical protein